MNVHTAVTDLTDHSELPPLPGGHEAGPGGEQGQQGGEHLGQGEVRESYSWYWRSGRATVGTGQCELLDDLQDVQLVP